MRIRTANYKDVNNIAHVHINSWKTTYKGIISDIFLANLSLESRITQWKSILNEPSNKIITLVLVNDEDQVQGFIYGGSPRDREIGFESEIYAFYLLEEVQGQGCGRQLIIEFLKILKENSYNNTMLWVLEKNSAVKFYVKMGGEIINEKVQLIGEESFNEIAIGWKDIRTY
ncbi:GNAT family N-acetyltransferase [Cohnella terricola]|uniref:GNAT family N-acetyltransferase n=1 Tax=Cohnella terricola TaxID=1289167 RepID=A0A559IV47_9BACL|nr:GNAT family N-acetyltransferase [Cohnella terricola]TVX91519.1 GNAT family N-acetyltransferase [Cohnella terricola]